MEEEVAVGHALRLVVNDLLAAFVVVVHHKLLLGWKNSMLADRKRQLACIQSLVATKVSSYHNISASDVTLAASAQTFLLLGAAEAAGGFLELIAVNFDHPEGTEHLGQVGCFVTAEKPELHTSDPTSGTKVKVLVLSAMTVSEASAHHAKRTQQYMMAAPMMATALPSFWMPSCPTLG